MRHVPFVLLLVFFAVVYRSTLDSEGMFVWDEAEYASIARSIVRGEGFSISGQPNSLRPPVVPLAAAAGILISGRSDDAAVRRPNLVFCLLALAVVYGMGSAVYDRATGLAGASLLGVSPAFWTSTPLVLTEIPFIALFSGAVACFYVGLHRDSRGFYASWLCWALAFLTRYTAILFAPIVALFAIMAVCERNAAARHRLFSRHSGFAACLGAAAIAPWFVRQQITFGDALIGVREASTQLQRFLPSVSMPWYFYLARLPVMLSTGVAALMLVGIGWVVARRDRFGAYCLVACLVIVGWFSGYRFKEDRQIMAALPFFALLASAGLMKTWASVRLSPRSAIVRAAIVLVIFGLNFETTRLVLRQRVTLGYPSFLSAMRWLRGHSSPQATVIGANYPQVFWYGDRRTVDFPERDMLPAALASSEWIVVTGFERGQRPYVPELLESVLQSDVANGDAAVFKDRQFETVLVRSSLLLKRL